MLLFFVNRVKLSFLSFISCGSSLILCSLAFNILFACASFALPLKTVRNVHRLLRYYSELFCMVRGSAALFVTWLCAVANHHSRFPLSFICTPMNINPACAWRVKLERYAVCVHDGAVPVCKRTIRSNGVNIPAALKLQAAFQSAHVAHCEIPQSEGSSLHSQSVPPRFDNREAGNNLSVI